MNEGMCGMYIGCTSSLYRNRVMNIKFMPLLCKGSQYEKRLSIATMKNCKIKNFIFDV